MAFLGYMSKLDAYENNLYRFEEVEVLAEKVCNVFAAERHDRKTNSDTLYNI